MRGPMGRRRAIRLGVLLVLCGVVSGPGARRCAAAANGDASSVVAVSRTFNDRPFSYRMRLLSERDGYCVYRLSYPSPVVTPVKQNNTIPADYYLPDGAGPDGAKRPAVVCLHILEGNFELVHVTCGALASRGIPAVMFKLPYYGERSLPGGRRALAADPRRFVEALRQAVQDVRRTIDVLASRPEVDPERIGLTGISLGGILAATAAGEDPRVWRTALILAGGDLFEIIHHAREARAISTLLAGLPPAQRAELERTLQRVDPLRAAPGLRGRAEQGRVLMINAGQDEVIPRQCTEKLASALGMAERVVWLEGLGHYTAMVALPRALQTTADFFAQDLPAEARPALPRAPATALEKVALLLRQAGAVLVREPAAGRCHFVELDVSVTLEDGRNERGWLRLARGSHNKLSLRLRLPELGEAALGQGAFPWMACAEKVVFKGTSAPDTPPGDPLAFADPQCLLKLQALGGALAGIALVPATLERWVGVSEEPGEGGAPAVRITRNDRRQDQARLVFCKDGVTPRSLAFEVEGVRGTVLFRGWQVDTIAHDSLFEPPRDVPCRRVDNEDLYRMFSALFNFAVEYFE